MAENPLLAGLIVAGFTLAGMVGMAMTAWIVKTLLEITGLLSGMSERLDDLERRADHHDDLFDGHPEMRRRHNDRPRQGRPS